MQENDFHLHSYEAGDTLFQIHPDQPAPSGAKICVVIGPNGSGKSRLAGEVVRELIRINSLRNGLPLSATPKDSDGSRPDTSTISYKQAGKNCRIERKLDRLFGWIEEAPASMDKLPFPSKLLAVAHLPVDKFFFTHSEVNDFYSYLGLRQATNLTTTGALEFKVVLSLFYGLQQPFFLRKLAPWLSLLGLTGSAKLRVQFTDKATMQIVRAGDFDNFLQYATELASRNVGSTRRAQSSQSKQKFATDVKIAWTLLRRLASEALVDDKRGGTISLPVASDMFEDNFPPAMWGHAIEGLRRLRLTSDLGLEFDKSDRSIRFQDLSSGEQQILGTYIRVLAEIRPNCIIFIDEPEVSLHPS